MSIDPRLVDLAARLDRASKRIERLETLEFETVAFPGGGGPTLLCDFTLAAPLPFVTICPGGIAVPPGFRHLWLIIQGRSTEVDSPNIELNINSVFTPQYRWYKREETSGGAPVGSADFQGGGFPPAGFDTKIELGRIDGAWPNDAFPGVNFSEQRGVMMVTFSDYRESIMRRSVSWFQFAQREGNRTIGGSLFHGAQTIMQGGGRRGAFVFIVSAILGIRLTHPGPGLFDTGSQFTLYGL